MSTLPVLSQILAYINIEMADEILNKCAKITNSFSVDMFIQNVILDKVVSPELSGRLGKKTKIIVHQSWLKNNYVSEDSYSPNVDRYYAGIYEIPARARFGRDIISAECIDMSESLFGGIGYGGGIGYSNGGISLNSLSNDMIDSRTFQRSPPKPTVRVNNNIITVSPDIYFGQSFGLICQIGYDLDYTNAEISFIIQLKKLVLLALKRWVYKTFVIKIDENEVSFGKELGSFKEIILGYGDLQQEYDNAVLMCVRANDWDKSIYEKRLMLTL